MIFRPCGWELLAMQVQFQSRAAPRKPYPLM